MSDATEIPQEYVTLSVLMEQFHDGWLVEQIEKKRSPQDIIDQLVRASEGAELIINNKDKEFNEQLPKPFDPKNVFGVPVISSEELKDFIDAPIPYVVEPIYIRGMLTQIQGVPKGGKSSFALYTACCAATGVWPYEKFLHSNLGPLNVLYITWEDPALMMAKRLSLYMQGIGFDKYVLPPNLKFLFAPQLFTESSDHRAKLIEAIQYYKADLVFIDTLSRSHNMEENSASEMRMPMANLEAIARDADCALCYIHHTAKSTDGKATVNKGRGSSSIAATWHVMLDWGVREEGSNVNPVKVESKLLHETLSWDIHYVPSKIENVVHNVQWQFSDTKLEDSKEEIGSTEFKRVRILKVLKEMQQSIPDGWVNSQMVADSSNLGLDVKSIKTHLQTLCSRGEVLSKTGPKNAILFKSSDV